MSTFTCYVLSCYTTAFEKVLTPDSKGEKIVAKAHGGPIEIFGVTVAQVDDKVRLQDLDTWFDPLEMFRQIAPYGVVNKEAMNRKVAMEVALDIGSNYMPVKAEATIAVESSDEPARPISAVHPMAEPTVPENDGVKIAQEHNKPAEQTAPEEVIPKHISNSTGEPADAFIPHQGADTEQSAVASADAQYVPAQQLVEAAATQGAEADMEKPESNFHDAQEMLPGQGGTADIGKAMQEKSAASETNIDVPRSIYSSSVTGNEEDRIKAAKSGSVVDESVITKTHDAVDHHLESSAEQVHPHPHDTEKDVRPEAGEAVAVPAQAEETRMTHEEMSKITAAECPFLMYVQ